MRLSGTADRMVGRDSGPGSHISEFSIIKRYPYEQASEPANEWCLHIISVVTVAVVGFSFLPEYLRV